MNISLWSFWIIFNLVERRKVLIIRVVGLWVVSYYGIRNKFWLNFEFIYFLWKIWCLVFIVVFIFMEREFFYLFSIELLKFDCKNICSMVNILNKK